MIVFENPGLIDLRAIKTFGWHDKIKENAIGFFGTGSRYALATLLRTGNEVVLWRGMARYTFDFECLEGRVNTFNVVRMKGSDESHCELPFTLDLGKQWEPWQAFRELYSNALDENGRVYRANVYVPKEGTTAFAVEGHKIEAVFNEKEKIFLNRKFIYEDGSNLQFHNNINNNIYYRGVKVYEMNRPMLFEYNIISQTKLTEDRTLYSIYDFQEKLMKCICGMENESVLEKMITAKSEFYEHSLLHYNFTPSDAFIRVYSNLRRSGRISEIVSWASNIFNVSKKPKPLPPVVDLSENQTMQLQKAIQFCKKSGWTVDEFPILVVPYATNGLLAFAEDQKIILTTTLFDMGIKSLVHGLYEEWLHLKFNFADCTREMQTFLFRQLITAKEEILRDPL